MRFVNTLILFLSLTISYGQVEVDFTADQTIGCEIANISFTDLSTSASGDIVAWDWEIGTVVSDLQNPGAILNQIGSYTVCLTVTDQANNVDSLCKEDYITIYPNPVADFNFIQNNACSPSQVEFTDSSSGPSNIVNWIWDVGGSANIINTQDPNESILTTYETGGSYSISLVIEDENGCTDIATENNVINITQSPEPIFSFNLNESCELPISASFLNLNVESGVDYEWDFGNGQTFTGAFPGNVDFDEDGAYTVTLTARRGECFVKFETIVNIVTDPQLDFQFPTAKCVFNSFKITSVANIPLDSVIWMTDTGLSFKGAGQTTIRIDDPGCYNFSARVFIGGCEYFFAFPDCVEVKDVPQLNFDLNYLEACTLPIVVEFSVDLPETANVNWLVDTPQGLVSLNGTNQTYEFTATGTYGLAFEYVEGGACTHDYVLDDIEVMAFGIVDPGDPIGGCLPIDYELDFQVNSVSPIAYHEWSVPDLGISSNNESVVINMVDPGAHDVIYIVENEEGCRDTIYLEDYISAGFMPVTGLDVFPIEQCADDAFQLIDQSSDFANQWFWLLSDSLNTDWVFGEDILEIVTDTGWIDVFHVAGHFGCFGDTIFADNAIHVLGPAAIFSIEQGCNSMDVLIDNQSVAADSFYFQIIQDVDTFIVEQDSFWFTFNQSGLAEIELFTFNDSTGCEMNVEKTILIPDFDLGFVSDTVRGCVPLELTFNFQDHPLIVFATDYGVITDVSNGSATVRYEETGAFPSPYLLRYRDECIDTISIDSIFVNDVTAGFTNEPIFCAPDNHELTNTSSSVFGDIVSSQWSLSPGDLVSEEIDPVFFIEEDTLFSVILFVEDSWGCKDTLEKPFAIKPRFLEAGFVSQQLLCVGQEVQFNNASTGEELVEYMWDFGDGNTSSEFAPVHSYQNEGLYDVCLIVIDNINCSDTICIENYIEVRNPIADFDGDPLSIDCPPLFTNFDNLSLYATDFIWDFGDNSGLSLLESPSHIYSEVGSYDVSLIASNDGLCPDTLLIPNFIDVDGPRGDWEFIINSNCVPLDVIFTGSSDGLYKYVWDFGNGEITTASSDRLLDTVSYSYSSTGVFVPKLLLDNNAGCIISVSGDTIVVNDINLDVDVGDSTYCVSPGIIALDNQSSSSGEDLQYLWTFNNGMENYSSELASPEFSILNAGQYELVLLVETENCTDSLLIEGVQIIEGIEVAATNDTICYNSFSDIEVSGDANYFEWYTIQGGFVGSSDSLNLQLTESQDYYVIGYRESCPNDTAFAFVEVYDPVIIELESEYTSYGNSFPQVELNYDGNYAFYWTPPGGLTCTNCPEPFIMPDTVTTYFVEVTDIDSGCMIDSLIRVETINDCTEEGLHTPNIFSPNRDGANDGVRVFTQRETDFASLGIYDRWGNQMFYSEDINQSWDGVYKSQLAQTGVYTLKIEGVCTDSGEAFVVYRDVSLVR